ncbi:MAG: GntR family transcriptional regulator [Chloroflexota bacterium]
MQSVDLRKARKTLADLTYDYVLAQIMAHVLKPGDSLKPDELATAMGISPTPVKQALSRLRGENLVDFLDGVRPIVAAPTLTEIAALSEARMMCETFAVTEGMGRLTDGYLAAADNILTRYETAATRLASADVQSFQALAQCEHDFHAHLVSLCANETIKAWHLNAFVRGRAYRVIELGHPGSYPIQISRYSRQHRDIQRALVARDALAAAQAIRCHLVSSQAAYAEGPSASASILSAAPLGLDQ